MRRTGLRVLLLSAFMGGLPPTASATTILFNVDSPELETWTTFSIPLSGGGWVVDDWDGGVVATQAQIQAILGNLQAMYILTEWRTGPDNTNVDNIFFGTGASDTFAANNGGWVVAGPDPESDMDSQVVPTSPLTWDPTFGNPAGSVREQLDPYFWTWISAPSAYLGNQSLRYGETLSLDIYIRFTDDVPYPLIALVGPDPDPNVVPEPATLMLVGGGLLGLARARWRRRS